MICQFVNFSIPSKCLSDGNLYCVTITKLSGRQSVLLRYTYWMDYLHFDILMEVQKQRLDGFLTVVLYIGIMEAGDFLL